MNDSCVNQLSDYCYQLDSDGNDDGSTPKAFQIPRSHSVSTTPSNERPHSFESEKSCELPKIVDKISPHVQVMTSIKTS